MYMYIYIYIFVYTCMYIQFLAQLLPMISLLPRLHLTAFPALLALDARRAGADPPRLDPCACFAARSDMAGAGWSSWEKPWFFGVSIS